MKLLFIFCWNSNIQSVCKYANCKYVRCDRAVREWRHLLQKVNNRENAVRIGHDKLLMTPHERRLSQQSSSEDIDWPSNELIQTQGR